jgi:hypothetical protein
VGSIPFGFQGQHTDDIDEHDKIVRAIEKLGARRTPPKTPGDVVLPKEGSGPRVSALRIREKNGDTRMFAIRPGKTYKVGRDADMNIVFSERDLTVSREHAKLMVHDYYVEVFDQGSLSKIRTRKESARYLNYLRVELYKSFFLGYAEFIVVP